MRVWLDDQIDDPDALPRHPPLGWVGVKTTLEACRLVATGKVTHLSLDHDLGEGRCTGYVVANFVEKRAMEGTLPRLAWYLHSANSVGVLNMRRALISADRFWSKHEDA